MNFRRNNKGFTLIEMLVILAIIAFLVSSIMLYLAQSRQKSRDAKRVTDVKQISAALDLYLSNCGAYPHEPTPIVLDDTKNLFTSSASGCGTRTGSSNVNGGIGDLPLGFALNSNNTTLVIQFKTAPITPDGSCTDTAGGPNGGRYTYTSTSPNLGYTLSFCLGQATGGFPAGFNTISR